MYEYLVSVSTHRFLVFANDVRDICIRSSTHGHLATLPTERDQKPPESKQASGGLKYLWGKQASGRHLCPNCLPDTLATPAILQGGLQAWIHISVVGYVVFIVGESFSIFFYGEDRQRSCAWYAARTTD